MGRVKMSDQPLPPIPPPPPEENEEDIPPPPPPPPLPPADETVSLEIDFEKLAERAAVIAREQQQQQQQHQQQKKRKQRDSPSGKKNIPPPPMPPVSLGGTVLDEVDLERIKVGDNRWGIALSSCVEYPNKKYFFSRKDSKVCQWETPKELKGGLQKNLRICPLEATLLPQNTMPESGWVELTTTTTTTKKAKKKAERKKRRRKRRTRRVVVRKNITGTRRPNRSPGKGRDEGNTKSRRRRFSRYSLLAKAPNKAHRRTEET